MNLRKNLNCYCLTVQFNCTFLCFCLKPLDRDQPNGRPQWRFTVFAQDEGGEGLVGYADVQVNLKDINDNAPIFPQGVYFGNVTENGTAGKSKCIFATNNITL